MFSSCQGNCWLFSAEQLYLLLMKPEQESLPSLPHDHGQSVEKKLDCMPPSESFRTLSEIFKELGDESRLRIFWLLCHCEECVINISSMVGMSSPAVSHHLKQLKAGSLIISTRRGKEVYYKAADTEKTRLLHSMIESMMEIACPWGR